MQKELPKYLAPRDKSPENNKEYKYIPKKIFQTFETNKVSSGMYDAVHTWIDKNPDWEYHFFDKDDRRNFIKDNFPKKVLAAYDTLIPGSYKADLFRFCVLYINGGVYNDIKQELLTNLNDIIPVDIEFIAMKDQKIGHIYTAFICSKPKHEFLKTTIEVIIENVEIGRYGRCPLDPTGPGAFGKGVNLTLGRPDRSPYSVGLQQVKGYKYILWSDDFSNIICRTDKKQLVFRRHYSSYYHEQTVISASDLSFKYHRCWFFDSIYSHGKVYRSDLTFYKKGIKSARASWVNSLYKYGVKRKARRAVIVSLKKGHISFRLSWLIIRHELVRPFLGIFKLRNKKILEV